MNFSHMIREKNGEYRDFESLYEQYFQEVFHYLVHCIGSVQDAEDVTAQVFLKALKNLWRFRWSRGSFSSWLFRIAHNEMKTYFRKRGRADNLWFHAENLEEYAPVVNEISRAEGERKRYQFYTVLCERLMSLPPEESSLLILKFFQGKSYDELGEIFKVKHGTLAMRVHRSLKKLKKHLDKEGMDHEEFRRSFENMSQA